MLDFSNFTKKKGLEDMKSVRIKPIAVDMVDIDITCDCGQNGMINQTTGQKLFDHTITLASTLGGRAWFLACICGKKFQVVSQIDHIHVTEL